jgi:hypothetical protein
VPHCWHGLSHWLGCSERCVLSGGGLISKSGADNAADAKLKAAQLQVDENKRQYNQTRTDQSPWTGTGAAAEGRLAYLLGLNPTLGNTQQSFKGNFGGEGTAYTVNGKTVIVPPGGQPPAGGTIAQGSTIPQFRPQEREGRAARTLTEMDAEMDIDDLQPARRNDCGRLDRSADHRTAATARLGIRLPAARFHH